MTTFLEVVTKMLIIRLKRTFVENVGFQLAYVIFQTNKDEVQVQINLKVTTFGSSVLEELLNWLHTRAKKLQNPK